MKNMNKSSFLPVAEVSIKNVNVEKIVAIILEFVSSLLFLL